jgi:hypothetical protein
MNVIKIFTLVLFLQVVSNLYSQTGEAKSLEMGNKWFYKSIDMFQNTLNYYNEVIGDTTIQNKQYAIIFHFISDTLYWFERADSSRIFRFNTVLMEEGVVVDFNSPDTSGLYFSIENDSIFFWNYLRARQCHSAWGALGEGTNCYIKGIGLSELSYVGHSANDYTELIAGIIEGVFYGDSTVLSIESLDEQNVRDFSLLQNYPNPFNPTTTIRFTISDLRFTILKVYDVLGNEIATLVNEEKSAGEYEVEFSTGLIYQTLPSGIYFYQLKAGNFVETKKMILLK